MFSDLIERLYARRRRVEQTDPVRFSSSPRSIGAGSKTSASKRKRAGQHIAHESRRRNFQT